MDDVIRSMNGDQFIGLAAVVLGCVGWIPVALTAIVTQHLRTSRQADAEAQLKRDLVAAGFTADDIERVVQATAAGRAPARSQSQSQVAVR